MLKGKELEEAVYEPEHIEAVLTQIEDSFPDYYSRFAGHRLRRAISKEIADYESEREAYLDYLDPRVLEEFDYDPNAFKNYTRSHCPIIRRCLMSRDEIMEAYQVSFQRVPGRELLRTVRNISEFGSRYVAQFDGERHENTETYRDLGLEPLNESETYCYGVIGYGVQSSLLYGRHSHAFAHRSQNAVWALYFLSQRKDFGLQDGSEFLMVRPDSGTCEQNYLYPAELFGFYALKVYLMLKGACEARDIHFDDGYRYVYLSVFFDYVADSHRQDIDTYRVNSSDRETRGWF